MNYLTFILRLASRWPKFVFYDYYVAFSAKVVDYVAQGYSVDWGEPDYFLFSQMTVGGGGQQLCNLLCIRPLLC